MVVVILQDLLCLPNTTLGSSTDSVHAPLHNHFPSEPLIRYSPVKHSHLGTLKKGPRSSGSAAATTVKSFARGGFYQRFRILINLLTPVTQANNIAFGTFG